jgi:hypothetical protein
MEMLMLIPLNHSPVLFYRHLKTSSKVLPAAYIRSWPAMAANSTQPVSVNPLLASETLASAKGWPTEDDWVLHRSTIKRLYLEENKKLKELMEIMKRQHALKAT